MCVCVCLTQLSAREKNTHVIQNSINCNNDAFMCDSTLRVHSGVSVNSNVSSEQNANLIFNDNGRKTTKTYKPQKVKNSKYSRSKNVQMTNASENAAMSYKDDVTLASKGYTITQDKPESSAFIGLKGGFSMLDSTLTSTQVLSVFNINLSVGYMLGFDFGYRHYLTRRFGFSYYGDVDFLQTFNAFRDGYINGIPIHSTYEQFLGSFNVDMFYDFSRSFGLDLGFGIGLYGIEPSFNVTADVNLGTQSAAAGRYSDRVNMFFTALFNFGFHINLNAHHSLYLASKIALIDHLYVGSRIPDTYFKFYTAHLGYRYYF